MSLYKFLFRPYFIFMIKKSFYKLHLFSNYMDLDRSMDKQSKKTLNLEKNVLMKKFFDPNPNLKNNANEKNEKDEKEKTV